MSENLALLTQLAVCGAISAVSVFLLIVVKKNPKRDERALAKRECLRARAELQRMEEGGASERRARAAKALRALNYARRLAQQSAYEDDNAAAGGVLENVIRAREIVAEYRKSGAGSLADAAAYLDKAAALIDDLTSAGELVRKKIVKR